MLDLLITHATLPDGRQNMSIAVQNGRITEVTEGLQAPAHETVDAGGLLVSPPFVDAHFHMDSTLSYGQPRVNESGTLLEGIALWGELKPQLTHDDIVQRALQYCDWAVARGLLAIRSHVDTSDPSLLPVQALLDVKQRVAPLRSTPWQPAQRSKYVWRARSNSACVIFGAAGFVLWYIG